MHRSMGWVSLALVMAGCGQAGKPLAASVPMDALEAASAGSWSSRVLADDVARFNAHDKNADGSITADELPDVPADGFQALDVDRDGKLSPAECAGAIAPRARLAKEFASVTQPPLNTPSFGIPPKGGNPIVFVPGYLDLELYFTYLKHREEAAGRTTSYVDLFPNIQDIRVSAHLLAAEIARVQARTGARQVDLVAHSEGGLISRYFIQHLMAHPCVDHLVTLGTPNHGTKVAYLGPGEGARQMQPGSDFLKALNSPDRAPAGIKVTSIRAGMDEIIVPHESPVLAGATNELVKVAEHATIFVLPDATAFVDAGLAR